MAINQFSHNSNEPLQVKDLTVSGTETIGNINAGVGSITSLTGTAVTYTTAKFNNLNVDNITPGKLYDGTNTTGTYGQVLVSTGSSVIWSSANAITITDDNLTDTYVYPTFVSNTSGVETAARVSSKFFVFNPLYGKIGIGTVNPADTFQVGTGFTVSSDGTTKALKYYGDGSNLTGLVPNTISLSTTTTPQFIGFSSVSSGINTSFATSTQFVFAPGNSGVGSLGIGTTAPTNTLHVQGDVRITGGIFAGAANTSGNNGQFLQSTGTGLQWVNSSATVGVATTSSIETQFLTFVLGAGSTATLGIGTAGSLSFTPSTKRLGVTSISLGGLILDNDGFTGNANQALKISGDGTKVVWGPVVGSAAGLAATGPSGTVQFNDNGSFGGASFFTFDKLTFNVGIGSSAPKSRLDVIGDGKFIGVVTANKFYGDGSTLSGISTGGSAGLPGQVQFNKSGLTSGAQYFNYDETKISVGIGTSVPAGRLSIANTTTGSSLLLVNDNLTDGTLFRVNDNSGVPLFDVDAGGTISMLTSGNVGIGTTVTFPTSKLTVGGSGSFSGDMFVGGNAVVTGILTAKVAGTVTGAAGTTGQVQVNIGGSFTGAPYFNYDATNVRVGIGTSIATGRLSIANTTTGSSLLLVNDNLSDGTLFRVNDNSGIPLFDVDAGGTISMLTSGNVGIGTTVTFPTSKLTVGGDMFVGGNAIITGILTAKVAGSVTGASGTTGQVQVNIGGSFTGAPYFNYDAANVRVGIGTSAPSGRLSIANTSTGTSLLLVNDNISDGSLFRVADVNAKVLFDVDSSGTILMPVVGNVGIGTTLTNPTSKLHVFGDAIITGILTAKVAGTVTGAAGTTGQVQVNIGGSFTGAPYFNYDAANVRVGIGTSAPSGRLSIANTSTGKSLLLVNDNLTDGSLFRVNDTDGNLLFDVDSSGTILMPVVGNVGIGSTLTNPTSKLTVGGSGSFSGDMFVGGNAVVTGILTAKVAGSVTGAAGTSGQVQVNIGGSFTGAPYFNYDAANVRVGIGTSAPSGRLSIANTSTGKSLLLVNDNLTDGSLFRVNDTDGNLLFDVDSSGTILMPVVGNVGIGTTLTNPTSKLHVVGDVLVSGILTARMNDANILNNAYVTGNVGIATTNPTSKLHVFGDAIITGILTAKVAGTVSGAAGTSGQVQVNIGGSFTGAPYFNYNPSTVSVGIGTSVPSGRLSIANTSTGKSLLLVNDNLTDGSLFRVNDTDGNLLFDVDSSGTILMPVVGNVGIGSTLTNPTSKLHVVGDAIITGILTAKVAGSVTGAAGTSGQVQVNIGGSFTGAPYFNYDAANVRVGIGTSAPSGRLSIANTSTGTSLLLVNDNISDGSLFRVADVNAKVLFDVDAGGNIIAPSSSTNFGIGTFSPSSALQVGTNFLVSSSGIVTATKYFGDGSSLTGLTGLSAVLSSAPSVQYIGFLTTNSGLYTSFSTSNGLTFIPSSGNLGIGTTNPLYKFTVADNTAATLGLNVTGVAIADFTGNNSNYTQVNNRNVNTSGSADFIVTADSGSDSDKFIDLGINNSTFSNAGWTINGATDGYLYSQGVNLSIGAASNNFLSFFAGGTLAANEKMRVNTTGVGIGTTNPTTTVSIGGTLSFSNNNIRIGDGNTGCSISGALNNLFAGASAGRLNVNGCNNIFLGCYSGCNTTASHNFFAGFGAGRGIGGASNSASHNVAIGCSAGASITNGAYNNFFGLFAGKVNTTGKDNNFFGRYAGLSNNTGCYNNFFGCSAGTNNTSACHNNFFGRYSGRNNTLGCNNTFFGFNAGRNNSTGNYNIFFGCYAGCCSTTGSSNFFVGSSAGRGNASSVTGSNNIGIGSFTACNLSTGSDNIFLGNQSGCCITIGTHNFFAGFGAAKGLGGSALSGSHNIGIGSFTGASLTSGLYNTFFGFNSGCNNTTGCFNFFVGCGAGKGIGGAVISGSCNVAIGASAGASLTSALNNIFFGFNSGFVNTTGNSNNYFGSCAGRNSTGSCNNFFGSCAGLSNTGNHNNFFGDRTGCTSGTGSYNNFFGRYAGCSNATNGNNNNFFGCSAGLNNTSGINNNFFGNLAGRGQAGSTASSNNIFGNSAGLNITSATDNNLFGECAGCCITTGSSNFFAGFNAGRGNTNSITGCNNIGIGSCAGFNITSGCFNNFLGKSTGKSNTSGNCNNFIGAYAGQSNIGGNNNNFFGWCSGSSNNSGCNNNFFGNIAGSCNTTGCNNNFFGNAAGQYNSSGNYNNFFGNGAGRCNSGCYNIFFGLNAGCNTTASHNFFAGCGAGKGIGGAAISGGANVAIGQSAGASITSGTGNFFVGNFAGLKNTAAFDNIFFGTQSGCNNSGTNNFFAGTQTGQDNTGSYNIFFGRLAGFVNTSGCGNNFQGNSAGRSNTTGNHNIFNGTYAGQFNTTASSNIFLGFSAGKGTPGVNVTGPFNVGIGSSAGASLSTGCHNVFFGCASGLCNTTGNYNTFFGIRAGCLNVSGSANNYFGAVAGQAATGSSNNYFGLFAGGATNNSGSGNNFFGNRAGCSNTSGNYNNFFGFYAGRNNTTGSDNVAIGRSALFPASAAGSNNIAIGSSAGSSVTPGLVSLAGVSNNIVLGNFNHTAATIKVAWTIISDERDKGNITPVPLGLNFVQKIKPIEYNWIDRNSKNITDNTRRYGFSAQNILEHETSPSVLVDACDPDHLKLRETMMLPVLVNAIKELDIENQELKNRILEIERRVGISSGG